MPSYDVSHLSAQRANQARAMRVALGLIGGLCAVIALGFLWVYVSSGGARDDLQGVVFGTVETGSIALAALMGFVIWKTGPGLMRISIGPIGITMDSRNGKIETLEWGALGRGFVLLDYTIHPVLPRLAGDQLWEIRRTLSPASFITKDAFEAILSEAARQALPIIVSTPRNPGWGWARCRVIRIGSTIPVTSGYSPLS